MFGYVLTNVQLSAALVLLTTVSADEKLFAKFLANPASTSLQEYTLQAAEDCGISYVFYGTRTLLDFDVTEIVDGKEKHLADGSNLEFYFGSQSFDPTEGKPNSPSFFVKAGLSAHKWGEMLRGMCVGEERRFLIPPHLTYGDWKEKAIFIDFELMAVDDKGFKEFTDEDQLEILTDFYAKVHATDRNSSCAHSVVSASANIPLHPFGTVCAV